VYNGNFYGDKLVADYLNSQRISAVNSMIDTTNDSLIKCSWQKIWSFNIGYCETTFNVIFDWYKAFEFTVVAALLSIPLQMIMKYIVVYILSAPKTRRELI